MVNEAKFMARICDTWGVDSFKIMYSSGFSHVSVKQSKSRL